MTKPLFQLIARDLNSDNEGWCWLVVVRFTGGPLATAEDGHTVTDEQIRLSDRSYQSDQSDPLSEFLSFGLSLIL